MHELGVAIELLRTARAEADARGGGVVEALRVEVGELAGVEPELLAQAWRCAVAGTPDAEARLELVWRPARQTCLECGPVAERQAGSWLRVCPDCAGFLRVEGGDELDLVHLELCAPSAASA